MLKNVTGKHLPIRMLLTGIALLVVIATVSIAAASYCLLYGTISRDGTAIVVLDMFATVMGIFAVLACKSKRAKDL